jgi:hypothetical protein
MLYSEFLNAGTYPFPFAVDSWSLWREGKWVSADGKTMK